MPCLRRTPPYRKGHFPHSRLFVTLLWLALADGALAQDSEADLAQELTNPLANLITLPIQLNHDRKIGLLDEGEKWQANVQTVVPFELNDDWNLISRTIVPVVWQDDVFPGTGSQFGLGDIN